MILITGIFGHIGLSTAIELSNNHKIVGIYNKNINAKYKKIFLKKNITIIKNNLTDYDQIKKIIQKYKISKVLYCAAVAHDSIAKKDPVKTINVNSLSVSYFLELLKRKKYSKFIYISTGSVFQNFTNKNKINESVTPTPKSLYASTKRLGEVLVESYKKNFNLDCLVLRVSWVYGPPLIIKKINPQRGPIPLIAYKISKGEKKIIFNSGKDFKAAFTYIKDVNNALELLLKKKKNNNCYYHLSGGKNYSNIELAKKIQKIEKNSKIVFGKGVHPWSNDSVIRPPLSSIKLDYKIKYNLEEGILDYINYLKKNA